MSKMDALRAMREAKFARTQARGDAPARTPRPALAPSTADAASAPAPDTDSLCGHRSMNGRTCTREAGHEAKSHRYGPAGSAQ